MPIPSTTASFTHIQNELGGTIPISLSEYYNVSGKFGFGIFGIPSSGLISVNNFRGKSKPANVAISIDGSGNTINTATDNSNFRYAYFASNGTFIIYNDLVCDILIVGGGGSGGGYSGGGGGGDVITKSNFTLRPGTYTINVGNGGIAPRSGSDNYINGNPGGTSSILSSVSGFIPIYAAGGGGGIGYNKSTPTITPTAGSVNDGNYSSGGGGGAGSDSQNYSSGSGNSVSGNGGRSVGIYGSGGGGGATGDGGNTIIATDTAGAGGTGFTSSITGVSIGYGGGGGGSSWGGPSANSGTDGGGNGGRAGTSSATDGITNRGGGGGGASTAYNGGNGGSGVVIVRYNITNVFMSITGTGNTINTPIDNINYRYAFFANTGIFTINRNLNCDILIIGGGGGGGSGVAWSDEAGAGGAGGVVYMVNKLLTIGSYNIVVGTGGDANTNGNDSFIKDSNNNTLIYDSINLIGKGGGKGASGSGNIGGSGGSGGGGCHPTTNGGSATQGNTFWNGSSYVAGGNNGGKPTSTSSGGGGGGAGENGNTDGQGYGGDGVLINITGVNTYYAGGGNAHPNNTSIRSDGGGGLQNGISADSIGLTNTGGGGGGGYTYNGNQPGGKGGSGVVIIRYSIN